MKLKLLLILLIITFFSIACRKLPTGRYEVMFDYLIIDPNSNVEKNHFENMEVVSRDNSCLNISYDSYQGHIDNCLDLDKKDVKGWYVSNLGITGSPGVTADVDTIDLKGIWHYADGTYYITGSFITKVHYYAMGSNVTNDITGSFEFKRAKEY